MEIKVNFLKQLAGIVTIFTIFSSIIFSQASLSAPGQELNFGQVKADEVQNRKIIINYHPEFDNPDKLEIWAEGNFLSPEKNQQLPANRVRVYIADEILTLEEDPSNLIQIDPKNQIQIVFEISLKPEDLQGEYKGLVFIRETSAKGEKSQLRKIPLRVKVEAWLNVEIDFSGPLVLRHPLNGGTQVLTEVPGKIKVSGNIPWELQGYLEEKFLFDTSLNIQVFAHQGNLFEKIHSDWVNLGEDPIPLAIGDSPALQPENYIEVEFSLSIEDFTRVRGGAHQFPLSIIAQPRS